MIDLKLTDYEQERLTDILAKLVNKYPNDVTFYDLWYKLTHEKKLEDHLHRYSPPEDVRAPEDSEVIKGMRKRWGKPVQAYGEVVG